MIDSPNRVVTARLGWSQPEHTIEYTDSEAVRLVELAGFTVERIVGVWNCADRGHDVTLLPTGELEMVRRAGSAAAAPATSFIWWLEARRAAAPLTLELDSEVKAIFSEAWPERLHRAIVTGTLSDDGTTVTGTGVLLHGPYAPLPPGRHRVTFTVDVIEPADRPLGRCDVVSGAVEFGSAEIAATECATLRMTVEFELVEMTFGIEARAFAFDAGAIAVHRLVDWATG